MVKSVFAGDRLRGVKVSVGEPFFNTMAIPAMVALLFLMGVGPALPWGSTTWEDTRRRLVPPSIGALVMGVIGIVSGARSIYAILAFAFVGFAAVGNLREYWIGMRARRSAHGDGCSPSSCPRARSGQPDLPAD